MSASTINKTKDLTKELEKQLKRLSLIQDEIGYSADIKHNNTISLLNSVAKFIAGEVDNVVLEKEKIIKEAENAQKSILSFKKLMGEFASNKAVLDPSKSLQANLSELQKEKVEVGKRYNLKLVHVKELYFQLDEFKQALGDFVNTSMLMSTTELDVSSLAVNALEEEIQRCQDEYVNRKDSVEDGVQQISNLLVMLGVEPENEQDKLIDQYFHEKEPNNKMVLCNQLVSEDNMRYIAIKIAQLEDMRQQVEFRKEEITQNLKHLWNRLHIEPQECETFLMANRGLTEQELQQYENELSRLLILKQERVGDFIQTAREELNALWDQLYYSEAQKKQFQPAFTDDLTDTILEAHENEISRLQLETEDSKYILERIEKHMKLKKEVEEFEAMTSDPNRLFGKGQRDPGRLLREEKFRKRISRELPKVTKELEGSLLEYEALKCHPFLVYGKSYFDVIYEEGRVHDDEKPMNNARNLISSQDSVRTVICSQEAVKPPVAPRTPKREITSRKPMTSPRPVKAVKRMFNTPQPNRVRQLNFTTTESPKIDHSESILHRVREQNIKKRQQKVIKRGHLFDDDDDDDEDEEDDVNDENTAPPILKRNPRKRQQIPTIKSQFESDDELDLAIFDDGPDLSDMSEIEDA